MFVFVNFIFVFEKFATVGNDRFFTRKDKKKQIWARPEKCQKIGHLQVALAKKRVCKILSTHYDKMVDLGKTIYVYLFQHFRYLSPSFKFHIRD